MLEQLRRVFNEQYYAVFAGASLIIWLAHFQFGSGSGGPWLLLMLVVSCCYLLLNRGNDQAMRPWEWRLLAVAALYVAVIFIGTWQLPGGLLGREGLRAVDYSTRFILALPIFFALRRCRMPAYWLLVAAGAGIITVLGAQLQAYYQGARGVIAPTGIHISQGEVITTLGAMLLLASWLLLRQGRRWLALLALGFWALSVVSILLSGTRGAWVAMLGCLLLFFLAVSFDSWRAALAAVVVITLLGVGSFYGLDQTQRDGISGRVLNVTSTVGKYLDGDIINNSPGKRIMMWEVSLRAAQERPLGHGSNSFNAVVNTAADADPRYNPVRRFGHAHNEFLNNLVENGWHGLLALVLLFGYPALVFIRSYTRSGHGSNTRLYSACGSMLIASYVGSGLTQALLSHHTLMLLFVILLYCCCAQLRAWEGSHQSPINSQPSKL